MKKFAAALVSAAALTACGPAAQRAEGPAGASNAAACALIADAAPLFGADAVAVGYPGLDGMDSSCEWTSADGARSGEIVLFTTQSLGSVTLDAKAAETIEKWDGQTETPLAPVPDLGEGAQIATGLPGYQAHVMIRQADRLILIAGSSGDASVTSEALALQIAHAISSPAAP